MRFTVLLRAVIINTVIALGYVQAFASEPCECCECESRNHFADGRNHLADKGITFKFDVSQFYYGVTTGGVEERFRYGGHGDYVANFDMGKIAGQEGFFVKLRAEHRFGQSISDRTGALYPATTLVDLPVADSENLYLTNVLLTQFLSERFAVFAGKMDTLDGDQNAFAHGRGKTQFSNVAFVGNPIAFSAIPYSTLGAGFYILGDEQTPVFAFSMLNATDTTKTSGFGDLFKEGIAISAETRLPTSFFDMPGHVNFGGAWNSRDFVELGQDPRVVQPNTPINQTSGTWALWWNGDQYLYVDPSDPQRGWGLFGRAGIADDDSNQMGWMLSFGLGGNNTLCGHEADTFGAGWYYYSSSNEIGAAFQALLGPVDDGQGVELFYNWQVADWLNITSDLQVIEPARDDIETAILIGFRAVMTL